MDTKAKEMADKLMTKKLADVAWLATAATKKVTPFTQDNFDLLALTLEEALKAVKDCKATQ